MRKGVVLVLIGLWAGGCSSGSPATDAGADADGSIDAGVDAGNDSGIDAGPRELHPVTLLGQGGFFGTSGTTVGRANGASSGSFTISAHYADIGSAQAPNESGRVYLFDNGSVPSAIGQAALVLQAPDGANLGGFGYSVTGPCDFNGDGHPDLAVSNHLFSTGVPANSGRVVVFWGDASGQLSMSRFSYHSLDQPVQSDCISQTVLCADFDGDGFDDLLATGQNAGSADTGVGAIFHGSAAGLPQHQDQLLLPKLLQNRQYFGSASLYVDLDGDGKKDLAIGGWGLIKGAVASGPHTGGLFVFLGGTDWSTGPSLGIFPQAGDAVEFGAGMIFFDTGTAKLLAVSAPAYGAAKTGAVFVYPVGAAGFEQQPPVNVLLPADSTNQFGFGEAMGYIPDYRGHGQGALLVGMKYADASPQNPGTGAVAVFALAADGKSFLPAPEILLAPAPKGNDCFGSAIVPLDDLDGDGLRDFLVGMESHIEGDINTGVQTGAVVFYR